MKTKRDKELNAFEKVFLEFLEIPSLRWKMKKLIEKNDEIDMAKLRIQLLTLEHEIETHKGGEKHV